MITRKQDAPARNDVVLPVLLELGEVHLAVAARVELRHGIVELQLGEVLPRHFHQLPDLLAVERAAPVLCDVGQRVCVRRARSHSRQRTAMERNGGMCGAYVIDLLESLLQRRLGFVTHGWRVCGGSGCFPLHCRGDALSVLLLPRSLPSHSVTVYPAGGAAGSRRAGYAGSGGGLKWQGSGVA